MHEALESPPTPHSEPAGWWRREAGLREALAIALPMMISSLSWTVMNFIDRLFLLKYSPAAVAAALQIEEVKP